MVEKILFVIVVFFSAYSLKRIGVFKKEDADVFINYVIYFSLPLLVFSRVREIPLSAESYGVVSIAWLAVFVSVTVSLLIGTVLKLKDKTLRSFLLVSAFGNTAFLGYPFAYAYFGKEGLSYAVLYDQLGSLLLVVSLGFFIATRRFSFRETAGFPPFIALIGGIITKNIHIPSVVLDFMNLGGESLIPVVLFATGIRFEFSVFPKSLRLSALALFLKMILTPFVVFLIINVLNLDSTGYKVALLESAMPPMMLAVVLAIKYNLDVNLALSSVMLGILLSFLTVPILISFTI